MFGPLGVNSIIGNFFYGSIYENHQDPKITVTQEVEVKMNQKIVYEESDSNTDIPQELITTEQMSCIINMPLNLNKAELSPKMQE